MLTFRINRKTRSRNNSTAKMKYQSYNLVWKVCVLLCKNDLLISRNITSLVTTLNLIVQEGAVNI